MSDEKNILAAEEAKKRGNAALKAKDYAQAIIEYSTAIEADPENAVYYSNRCAAYLETGRQKSSDLKLALDDAESAIFNKPTWAKAYSRKAMALWLMKKYDEAIETFNKALEYSPNDAKYLANIKQIEQEKNNQPSMFSSMFGGGKMLMYLQMIFHSLTLLCTVFYVIPFIGSRAFFYHGLKASFACQVVTIIRHHGAPKFSKDYAGALARNPESYYMMPAMFYHMSYPTVVMLLPACLRAAMFMAQIATYYEVHPMVSAQAQVLNSKQAQLMEMHSQLEYLRIRYMTNSDIKRAFQAYGAKLDSVFMHQYCPGIIGTIWGKIKQMLAHMGDVEAAQNQRCSIM